MRALFIMHYFEMGIMVYNKHNNGLQSASINRRFFEYHTQNGTNSTTITYQLF